MSHHYVRMSRLCSLVAGVLSLALPALSQTIASPSVPSAIQVPSGNVAYVKAYASGTQNYVCLPSGSSLGWKFQGPQATLFLTFRILGNEIRQQIMTHYLSPNPLEAGTARATWQSSVDTSAVWAKKTAESSDPAYVAPGAIPWFLLEVTGAQRGPTGGSMITGTTYIQRVNTTGGSMPATACTEAGSIAFVPYTAEYVFYRSAASH